MSQTTLAPCPECRKLNRVPIDSTRKPVCGHCKSELKTHGALVEVTGSELGALIEKSPLPIVVDFWAPWCGPCRSFAPTFEQAARTLAGRAVLAKLNTQEHALAADTYRIRSIPTLAAFKGGIEQSRVSGALPLPDFLAWVEQFMSRTSAA